MNLVYIIFTSNKARMNRPLDVVFQSRFNVFLDRIRFFLGERHTDTRHDETGGDLVNYFSACLIHRVTLDPIKWALCRHYIVPYRVATHRGSIRYFLRISTIRSAVLRFIFFPIGVTFVRIQRNFLSIERL